jgi:pyruvate-ferredoxin/flavodoxin oxidoreductase
MSSPRLLTVDGNEAVASVAHRVSETIAIYPITPSSPMAELADEWSAHGRQNVWGVVPRVVQLQSEAGAAGTVHGALQAGALTTTFTASQGLLLMIPNLYKIAGELTPFCMHVAARTLATHALSIFGDHSDVMACRQIGLALLASGSVQEAHDLAAVAHAATLRSRVPFLHFFDGFRTSHEVAKIAELSNEQLLAMMDEACIAAHRARGLDPEHPVLRGTAQNPDAYFQAREACNPFHAACPSVVQEEMDRLAQLTGRRYQLVDYHGHPEAERVVVAMGSGAEVAHEAVDWLVSRGEKVGVLKIRLYRPFPAQAFLDAVPRTARALAVLDRTKEPGAPGEPLYLDVLTTFAEARSSRPMPLVVGGRYGLSSKEFDPGMVRAIFENLGRPEPKNHFTIGIVDDVSRTSLEWQRDFEITFPGRTQAVFYGLGADGTVGANKASIKIIGEETEHAAQGYFVYDSKKSGAMTISHLRFGPGPIRSSYLVKQAGFLGVHQFQLVDRLDVLELAAPGAVVLINAPHPPDELWDQLPREFQQTVLEKRLQLHVIDAVKVAQAAGMGGRINAVMQACFFALSGVLPRDEAIAEIKKSIQKTYGKKGAEVVRRNHAAVDASLAAMFPVPVPGRITATRGRPPVVAPEAPDFVRRVTAVMLENKGDLLPVSAFPVDGTWPTSTARWEKRNLALEIPVWDAPLCIQCNKCALVCPHAAIRTKVYGEGAVATAPQGFKHIAFKGQQGSAYTVQVAPEDCTGCGLCVEVCPAKDKANPRHKALDLAPQPPLRIQESKAFEFFLELPEVDRTTLRLDLKGSQFLQPLMEFSGACAGCGETPYIKMLTQLFGDRLIIANATGCSSIYGGNLPTTPYTVNREGRGPAWANSLFEDNAEFGFGIRLGADSLRHLAEVVLKRQAPVLGDAFVTELLEADQSTEGGIAAQRKRVAELKSRLKPDGLEARKLLGLADHLVKKSVWIVGGDGWAYDIGYGGLDHVLSTDVDVNILVLDTEVYSNTGGQQSKATPLGAAAKFAAAGKSIGKKDLGLLAMGYRTAYVAQIAFGAKDAQTVKALLEAESYRGPSLVIAYSHCIAHGYDLVHGLEQQKRAVDSATWPLYRFDPRRIGAGQPPLVLDSGPGKLPVREYMRQEARFRITETLDPDRYRQLLIWAQQNVTQRYGVYEQLAKVVVPQATAIPDVRPPPAAAVE